MGRKLRFYHAKAGGRSFSSQKKPLVVSISVKKAFVLSVKIFMKSKESEHFRDWQCLSSKDYITLRKLLNDENDVFVTVRIFNDRHWTLSVNHALVPISNSIFNSIPESLSLSSLCSLLELIENHHYCIGNQDSHRFEDYSNTDVNVAGTSTLRSTNCEFFVTRPVKSLRCNNCLRQRHSLMKRQHRLHLKMNQQQSDPSSHTNYRYLSPAQMKERMHKMNNLHCALKVKVSRLEKVKKSIVDAGLNVIEDDHNDLVKLMDNNRKRVYDAYPENSFQRIFWDQQQKAATYSCKKSMKWHPIIIKWCLYLQYLSSGAYETLRTSGVISLLSQRTLRDYTHYIDSTCGFSDDIDEDLVRVAQYSDLDEWQKYVSLIIDEVHVKEDLVYDEHTGALIGYTSLGDVNDKLLELESNTTAGANTEIPTLANSICMFMVRGLFTNLEYPYVQIACKTLKGELLYQPFWEAVFRLEFAGFKVLTSTFNGASVNRRLIKIHTPNSKEVEYKVVNPYSEDNRFLYFLSDPPHLMKTTRNCWSNNNSWCRGRKISWTHLASLYHLCNQTPGLSIVHKIKYEHIYLTSYSKMGVDLAAQVLSDSVSKAMALLGNEEGEETSETAVFCDMFNKFFDCLNVRNYDDGKLSRNAFKSPYRSATDFRLKWLEDTFLKYLDNWRDSVEAREGYTAEEKRKMLLSTETRTGLVMTGVKTFLSERISEDPIEKFFGCQRQRGKSHKNPNVHEFCKGTQALRVINNFCRAPIKGNCHLVEKQGRALDMSNENLPLPKRRKQATSLL